METEEVRVLPADVYDALELSALEFGGIGKDVITETQKESPRFGWLSTATSSDLRNDEAEPCCIHGHAIYLAGSYDGVDIQRVLFDAGIDGPENDSIFKPAETRISFETWCKRLNVVRGDQ